MGIEDYMPQSAATNASPVSGGGKGGMKEMVKAVKAATLAVKAAKSAVKAARHTKRVCPRYCRRKTLRCKRYVRINRRKTRRSRK
jgi:hypothetical protein